jgi:hypothetical protein
MKKIDTTILMYFIFLLILILIFFIYKTQKDKIKEKEVITKHDTVFIVSDSISQQDQAVCDKLYPELVEREGFSDTLYTDKNGYHYYGYGHMISDEAFYQYRKNMPIITEAEADILLRKDIVMAYWEVQRKERPTLYKKMFNVFISGDTCLYKKKPDKDKIKKDSLKQLLYQINL